MKYMRLQKLFIYYVKSYSKNNTKKFYKTHIKLKIKNDSV